MKKTETAFRMLKPAVLQDGVGGSALITLCIFEIVKGESSRMENKSPPPGVWDIEAVPVRRRIIES